MNDITRMLVQSTTKMMKDVCTKELVNEAEKGQWAEDLWDILAESGLLTIAVPEELEGTGGSYADAYQILRLAGKYSAPIPLAETYMGNWLLADLGVVASNEPLAILVNNSQPFQLRKDQDGWIVSGKAQSVPWARNAKQMLVLGEMESGAVLAIVNPVGAELSHGSNIAGEPRDTVILDATRVEDRHVFSVDAQQVQEHLLYTGALCRSVMMAGALERIVELTITYSKERTQFGKPIHRFQAVQHHLAHLTGEIAAADTAARYAVDASEKGSGMTAIAMANIRINEAAGVVAPVAHQVHGAIGFTHEHVLHQSTRRVLAWRDEWGTETEWSERLGEQLMQLEENGLWPFLTL